MESMDKYWLWMVNLKGLGNKLCNKLLGEFGSPWQVYNASESDLKKIEGIGSALAHTIAANRCLDKAERLLESLAMSNIKLLTIKDSLYPLEVKSLPNAPVLLYYKGQIRPQSLGVAIVGARRCTEYGKKVTREAAAFLAKQDIPVISGMAKGIDGYAHTACLKEGGYTLAFLGNGVDICYPKEHQDLMEAIIEKGAVVSQYPPGTPARRGNFPMRNYLISAWAHKILVVEASLYSGSLITAQWGMENNRTVLAVPSGIYHSEGKGTNRLIKNGAQIYIEPYQLALDTLDIAQFTEPNDKLRSKHMTSKTHLENSADEIGNSLIEEQILEFLGSMTLNEDQLAQPFQSNLSGFLEALSILELKGKIRRRPGGKISC